MKIEKDGKLGTNLHDKTGLFTLTDFIQIRNGKQVLNYKLILKKVYRVIKFNLIAWLKLYIDMNTEVGKRKKII